MEVFLRSAAPAFCCDVQQRDQDATMTIQTSQESTEVNAIFNITSADLEVHSCLTATKAGITYTISIERCCNKELNYHESPWRKVLIVLVTLIIDCISFIIQ